MKWYLAKIVFRIITSGDSSEGLFEEKLRLVSGNHPQEALQNAASWGEREEAEFMNASGKKVTWEFIAVSGLRALPDPAEDIELDSHLVEMPANEFIALQRDKQEQLFLDGPAR